MGRIALVALSLAALYLVIVSAPDVARYIKISRM